MSGLKRGSHNGALFWKIFFNGFARQPGSGHAGLNVRFAAAGP
jgi:hypothetical protein